MDSDTDDDGLDDGVEVFSCTYGSDEDQCTNPLLWDSDGDGIDAVSYTHLTLPTNREV